jgi:hypothetical protein
LVTVLTRELAAMSVPRQVLVVEGIHDEDPLPTRSYEEMMRARAFPYVVQGRPGRMAERMERIYPPVHVASGIGTREVVVGVRTRQSLEMLEREFTQVKPHLVDMIVVNTF